MIIVTIVSHLCCDYKRRALKTIPLFFKQVSKISDILSFGKKLFFTKFYDNISKVTNFTFY